MFVFILIESCIAFKIYLRVHVLSSYSVAFVIFAFEQLVVVSSDWICRGWRCVLLHFCANSQVLRRIAIETAHCLKCNIARCYTSYFLPCFCLQCTDKPCAVKVYLEFAPGRASTHDSKKPGVTVSSKLRPPSCSWTLESLLLYIVLHVLCTYCIFARTVDTWNS